MFLGFSLELGVLELWSLDGGRDSAACNSSQCEDKIYSPRTSFHFHLCPQPTANIQQSTVCSNYKLCFTLSLCIQYPAQIKASIVYSLCWNWKRESIQVSSGFSILHVSILNVSKSETRCEKISYGRGSSYALKK